MGKVGYGRGDRDRREVLEGVDLGETTRVFAGMVRAGWLVRDGGSTAWCVAYGIC